MNSSPVSARALPGDCRVRFKGWEGRWRLFRPAKGIWKLWPTSICLLHIRRHSTFLTFVVVVVLVVRLVAPLLLLLPLSLPSLPSFPPAAAFCHQAIGKREREEEWRWNRIINSREHYFWLPVSSPGRTLFSPIVAFRLEGLLYMRSINWTRFPRPCRCFRSTLNCFPRAVLWGIVPRGSLK